MTDSFLASLSKRTRERLRIADEVTIEKQPTASVGLNLALGGGLAYGRIVTIYGNKSAGKSSLALLTIAKAQQEGKTAAWIDAEQSFDPNWARRLGVDTSKLYVSRAKSIKDMLEDTRAYIEAGIDIVVVDSISALLPSSYFEKEDKGELKGLDGTKQIGSFSKDLANAINMINYINNNTLVIMISQLRNQITTYGAMQKPQGGHALMFFSSTIVRVWSTANDKEQIKQELQFGDSLLKRNVGRPVDWLIEYNKTGSPGQSGQYDFYYAGDFVGIDEAGELLDLAATMGVIDRGKTGWYTINETSYQGRPKAVLALKEHPELFQKLKDEVYARI